MILFLPAHARVSLSSPLAGYAAPSTVSSPGGHGGFFGQLTAWCEQRAIPYQGVPVGTLKKHATGRGNADKGAMIAAMQAKGFRPADDNEADALALLVWAMEYHGVAA